MTRLSNQGELGASRQSGAVLVVGLIMVLLMTIVGLAAIRGSGLQEIMAGNMRERNMAFQVAEAGLRVGEAEVDSPGFDKEVFGTAVDGYYDDLGVPANNPFDDELIQYWSDEEWESRAVETNVDFGDDISAQPRYLVEKLLVLSADVAASTGSGVDLGSLNDLGLEAEYYRVTSRGESETGTSKAVVQSTYRVR